METLSTNLQLARLVGVQGTPATIIGDEMIPGAVSWETLEAVVKEKLAVAHARHCCKVSDEAAFCLIQRPYISKTLLTRRISPRGSP